MSGAIWILAAPFCGASRLATWLGRHPQVYATPELHLFLADDVGGLLDAFRIGQGEQSHGLLHTLADVEFGNRSDAAIAAAWNWLERHRSLRTPELVRWLVERAAPRRLVVPDSGSSLRPQDLDRLRSCDPPCRTLHLVRHPWQQGGSMAAWARGRLFIPPDFKDHGFHPAQVDPQIPWLRCNLNIAAMRSDGAAVPGCRLRIEDVQADPVAALQPVMDTLGLRSDAETMDLMAQPRRWTFAPLACSVAPIDLDGDAAEIPDNRVKQESAGNLLDQPVPWLAGNGRFDAQVKCLAREFGYQ